MTIAVWAALLMICGEFPVFTTTMQPLATRTLGDVQMSSVGDVARPTCSGRRMLMFGVSTAMVYAVVQRLIVIRYALRD
jgi:hypothetical protein